MAVRDMHSLRRPLLAATVLAPLGLLGCQQGPGAPDPDAVRGMRGAADAAERAWGVPADLVLAVAWTETRFRLPAEEEAAHLDLAEDGGHQPTAVGVGGIRPWLPIDPVAMAERRAGVDRERIDRDAAAGVLATAAVLATLWERRHGDVEPAADDPGAWVEELGDYAGLEDSQARLSYAQDVLDRLRRGLVATAVDGERIRIAARDVWVSEGVGEGRAYVGADYPAARWVPASSTNYSSRRGETIQYVIVHTTQGSYSGAISWFQNSSSNVSAHFVIRSSDGEVTQMVHESDNGWHAGNSTYNRRSVGLEHEGYVSDPGRWYTDAMYRSSATLTRYLCDKYGIPMDRSHIIGHVEVPGATHTDPGSGWDWPRYMALVRGTPSGPAYAAELVGQDAPAEMVSGERAVAWVEVRNTGSATWDLERTRLGTTGPRDHASPFFDGENWLSDHRATAPDHSTYGPGTVGRFTFMIQAPEVTEDTTVSDTFGLVQEGETWFGPEDIRLSVLVHPRVTAEPDAGPGPDPESAPDAGAESPPDAAPAPDPGPAAEPGPGAAPGSSRPESASLTGGCSAARGDSAANDDSMPATTSLALLALLALRRRRP